MSFASHLNGRKYFLDLIFLFLYESYDNSLIKHLSISNIVTSNILIMEEVYNLFPWIFLQVVNGKPKCATPAPSLNLRADLSYI